MKYFNTIKILLGIFAIGISSAEASNLMREHNPADMAMKMDIQKPNAGKKSETVRVPSVGLNTQSNRLIQNVEGREVLYNKECIGVFDFFEDAFDYGEILATKVIWNEDHVYFYNILGLAEYDSYVEGIVSGNTITINFPQRVYINADYGYSIDLVMMKLHETKDEYGRDMVEYLYDPTITSVTYTIQDDGVLELVIPGDQFDGELKPDYAIGYVYSDNKEWVNYCDFYQRLVPTEGNINTLPPNIEMREYTFVYGGYGVLVKIGFDEDMLYIQGLNPNIPDGVIYAKIEGDEAIITQDQIMCIYNNCFMYTKCVYDNPNYDYWDDHSPEYIFAPEDAVFKLKISEDKNTISSIDPDMYLCLNGARDRLYYLAAYRNFCLNYQSSFAGTPKVPFDPYWYDEFFTGGAGSFFFSIADTSEEGSLLDTEHLYYRMYVDGEVKVFQQEENPNGGRPYYYYLGLTEPTTLIPYNFMNWQDIYLYADTPRRMVDFYNPDITTVGVQAVYVYEGVTTESDILSYNITTGETTILPGQGAGVSSVLNSKLIKGIYNMQGVMLYEQSTPEIIQTLSPGLYVIDGKKVLIEK